MDPRVDEIIAFWFGHPTGSTPDAVKRWFQKDAAFDAECRSRFGALLDAAVAGKLAAWRGTARSELALLIVLDQLPRNLFRDDPRAFAHDAVALPIALELVDTGRSRELGFEQRMVAALALQHAEDGVVQQRSVAELGAILAEARAAHAPERVVGLLASGLDFAERHAQIIARFGRFPHRNAVLGRESTDEERAFLTTPGSSF